MRPVELLEMLEARERRVLRQQELLRQYQRPLVCFTMNIAGPVKNSEEIAWGFQYGSGLLLRQLDRAKAVVLYQESCSEVTGCEAFFVVDLAAERLKALMVELEDNLELGRLFDLDVIAPDGQKLERQTERCCIICGKPGKGCARSRAHSVAELQEKTTTILRTAQERWKCETVGELACRALLYEACTTPKPGLVDCRNNGSHKDMDLFSFLSSAAALQPYFMECVQIGLEKSNEPPQNTFAALRWPGKLAELRMLDVTGGVNTHKGAIFTMGVLCGALGRLEHQSWKEPARILRECAAMTQGVTEELRPDTQTRTAGERAYREYGSLGIRGQIEAGLPAVLLHGLPALKQALRDGSPLEEAGCMALLALIAQIEDTNLLKRGGKDGQQWAARQAETLLKQGLHPTKATLETLDQAFIERNLSPGGAADLLAVCYFLHFLETET